MVSGSSRAFTIDWEQQRRGLLSHQGSLVQISNGNREAAALCTVTKKKMQVLLQRPGSLPQESLPVPLSKLQADTLFLLQVPSAGETIAAFFFRCGHMEARKHCSGNQDVGVVVDEKKKKSYYTHFKQS